MEINKHFLTSAADADFQRFDEWYGDAFYEAVDHAIGQLRRPPKSGLIFEDLVRRLVIRGNPLGLFDGLHS